MPHPGHKAGVRVPLGATHLLVEATDVCRAAEVGSLELHDVAVGCGVDDLAVRVHVLAVALYHLQRACRTLILKNSNLYLECMHVLAWLRLCCST